MSDPRPIGVFDSGIGGLTVLKEMVRLIPGESYVYLGDTARVPYGTKSHKTVVRYSLNNVRILLENDVKMIVIACNTASSHALPELERSVSAPVVGVIEGGVAAAVERTSGRIGVIGTEATISSGAYRDAIKEKLPDAEVISRACPLFVALAEEGWVDNAVARAVAKEYLERDFRGRVDTLVLGCTHYPLLKKTIQDTLGPETRLIDSAEQTAILVSHRLKELDAESGSEGRGEIRFMVTDSPERSLEIGKRMLGGIEMDDVELVDVS